MRNFSIEESLNKKIKKIAKKDKALYEALMNKINEILNCADVNHYKNLMYPLQDYKRVHIKGPFVMIFEYIQLEDKVIFFDFDHHDNIYKH